ncbi:MAG: hypothetical protein GF364_12900 [Candidatus Lokiarchaeota archaeon]|nr:hypothetical protein [Candidatus Lokiarchaeota archaeon]
MKITKWFSEDEAEGYIESFLKKFDAKTLDGVEDVITFYGAMGEGLLKSEASDDEDKREYAEIIQDDVEEYESLAYYFEVRGHPETKACFVLTPEEKKVGLWEGEYEPLPDINNNVYMDMEPEVSKKIMYGDPNTDPDFFAGDLTVKGPLKLAVKPRDWIAAFFDFIGRDVF